MKPALAELEHAPIQYVPGDDAHYRVASSALIGGTRVTAISHCWRPNQVWPAWEANIHALRKLRDKA